MDLRKIFLGLQGKMIGTLEAHRAALDNRTTRGTASELQWLAMLAKYLPERYCVTSGFVLDSGGLISDQIDIIIYDRHYSPLLFDEDGARYADRECQVKKFWEGKRDRPELRHLPSDCPSPACSTISFT